MRELGVPVSQSSSTRLLAKFYAAPYATGPVLQSLKEMFNNGLKILQRDVRGLWPLGVAVGIFLKAFGPYQWPNSSYNSKCRFCSCSTSS